MQTNLEIEFKSVIDSDTYQRLMQEFKLFSKSFIQVNYYFDTINNDLRKNNITLRIRYKNGQYKLTSKTHYEYGTVEKHLFLSKEKAQKYLNEPFNANIIGLNYEVKKIAELETTRAKVAYQNGMLFFDKNNYYGITDYEIEYEVCDKEEGQKIFLNFLTKYNLQYQKGLSKSKRAILKATSIGN